ncbi:MAG: hypothetical protein KBC22_01420 [Candidatus Pacebacteria bacterium]|nr:hypothetical protein [Candidatus Paceibacterota bacterium]
MYTSHKTKKGIIMTGALGITLLLRLLPFRPPNVEPLLATQMPFAKVFGPWSAFFFAFSSIFLYDFITQTMGVWTVIVSIVYGLVGVGTAWYVRHKTLTTKHYVGMAVIGTLVFDILTGFTIGPLFFGQPLLVAIIGQIPFTAIHMAGNVLLAATLSPVFEKYLQYYMSKESRKTIIPSIIHPKQII